MFPTVFSQVLILFILISLGYILTKFNMITKEGATQMTDIALIVVTPCVIIKSFVRPFDKSELKDLLLCFLITAIIHIGFIAVSAAVFNPKYSKQARVRRFAAIFSNSGFVAIPLQQAIIGDNGVFYGSAYLAVFNVIMWTYGVYLMSGDRKYIKGKSLVLNPGLIGVTLGLIIFLFSIPLPKIIYDSVSYVAALNTPLPMIILGYYLAKSNPFKVLKSIPNIVSILFRNLLLPLAAMIIMYLCGIRGTMLTALSISACAPAASACTMFSAKFDADTPLSVGLVSLSTALSLISVPIVITLSMLLA